MTLTIYCKGSTTAVRCRVERWTFHDKYMGEQYVTFDVKSPTILQWEVGDYCIFRGQAYTLNYIPSCKQQARMYETGDAFVYEGIKFNSYADELTRCIMLDVVPTTGDYDQYKGTNYTGSAVFSLYCGETEWDGKVYAPVHTLADRIKANLDRLYPNAGWEVKVNDAACTSDDAVLSFNNWTATQALAEAHNTFKCDYAIIGRTIYIGYSLPELTSTQDGPEGKEAPESVFYFGYGKGYPTAGNGGGMGLFEIKKVANSNQNIITRLRAYGSTKNLPYRYYMSRYNLPQTMYVHNLQLPDTFLPYDKASDPDGQYARHKDDGNTERDTIYGINGQTGLPNLRHVLGETNDAYVDKGDDAAHCEEGIREGVGAWDGSQSDLEEIYPTIQGMTYGELRASAVPDVFNISGSAAYKSNGTASPYYQDAERVDELLAIGEDCNIGDGIVPLGELEKREVKRNVDRGVTRDYTWVYGTSPQEAAFADAKGEFLLTTIEDVLYEGNYTLSPTYDNVILRGYFGYVGAPQTGRGNNLSYTLAYKMRIVQVSKQTGVETEIASYTSDVVNASMRNSNIADVPIVAIPDKEAVKDGETPQVQSLHVSEAADVKVYFRVLPNIATTVNEGNAGANGVYFHYEITHTDSAEEANLIWSPVEGESIADGTFHIQLKELGFDLSTAQAIDDGARQLTMKTGNCVGRTFDIVEVKSYTDPTTRKRGWDVELSRASDDTIHVYYPNVQNTLQPGDRFVLTNIELPDAYIKAAEVRLLRAATDYLADNCETKYTYEPALNDIYLQQNYEKCLAEGEKEKSILWRLYAGLKLPFRGIPESEDELDPLPEASITISQVEIKIGEKPTPQVTLQLNDDLEQSTIQKLTTTVDRIYNSINGYAGGQSGGGLTSAFYQLLRTEGAKMFLSRLRSDTAVGPITFEQETTHEQGALFGATAEIDADGDATLRNIDASGEISAGQKIVVAEGVNSEERVASFGETEDSMSDGKGTLITADGRVQTTKMEVRGTLTVLDMVASQIHSLDGYYYFSDTMKIASVTDASTAEQPNRYRIVLEKDVESDRLKFYKGDVLLSIKADLDTRRNAERTTSEGGNTQFKDISSWSWMYVNDTCEENAEGGDGTDLWMLVTLYGDDMVPGNTAPKEGAYVARRGNFDTGDTSLDGRRNAWCISVEEGRLVYYINQTGPAVNDENYGVVIGKLPDIGPVRGVGKVGEIGIYAKDLLYQNAVSVRWAGDVQYVTHDKGAWDAALAAEGEYFYKRERDEERNVTVITRCQVTHNECTWLTDGTQTAIIEDEPSTANSKWLLLSGGSRVLDITHYYTTTETANLDEGGVGMGADEVEWVTDQDELQYDAFRPYMWGKTITKTTAYPDGYESEPPHIIGVFGETGEIVRADIEDEMTAIGVDSDGILQTANDISISTQAFICKGAAETELPIVLERSHLIGDSPEHMEVNLSIDAATPSRLNISILLKDGLDFTENNGILLKFRVTGFDGTNYYNRFVTHEVRGNRDAADGKDAVVYSIRPSADVITVHNDGSTTPTSLTLTAFKTVGSDAPMATQAYFRVTDATNSFVTQSSSNIYKTLTVASTQLKGAKFPLTVKITETQSSDPLAQITIGSVKDGQPGEQGVRGYAGCISRCYEDELVHGKSYRSDGDTAGLEVRFQDYLAVSCSGYESGYIVFRCKKTFTYEDEYGNNFNVAAEFDNAADIINYLTSSGQNCLDAENVYFEEVSVNDAAAFFLRLIARNAYIRMLNGSQFVITNDDGDILAGMGNMVFNRDHNGHYEDEDGYDDSVGYTTENYLIWAGAQQAKDAPFRVDTRGNAYMQSGIFGGLARHDVTVITAENVMDYVYWGRTEDRIWNNTEERYVSLYGWVLDIEKAGANVVFFSSEKGIYDPGLAACPEELQGFGRISEVLKSNVKSTTGYRNTSHDMANPSNTEYWGGLYILLPWAIEKLSTDDEADVSWVNFCKNYLNRDSDWAYRQYREARQYIGQAVSYTNATYRDMTIRIYGADNKIDASYSGTLEGNPMDLHTNDGGGNSLGHEITATCQYNYNASTSVHSLYWDVSYYGGFFGQWYDQVRGFLRKNQ